MKVSVKMITYNHAPYIAQAIEGVLAQQTTFPVELVIGDDGSTDETPDIIRDYAARYPERITAVIRDANVGMVANFFDLDAYIDGDYLAFCEGDDYWDDPHKLQVQVNLLEQNRDYSLIYTDVRQYVQGVGFKAYKPAKSPSGSVLVELLNGNFISTVTVLVRTSIYNEVSELVHEAVLKNKWRMIDYPLWIEAARNHKIGYHPHPTAVYRVLGESASHSVDPQRQIGFVKSVLDVVSYYVNHFGIYDQCRKGIANKVYKMYRIALKYNLPSLNMYREEFHRLGACSKKTGFYLSLSKNALTEKLLAIMLRCL